VIGAKISWRWQPWMRFPDEKEIESNMEGLPSKTDSELTEASDWWSGYVWFMIFV